jgi:hypothetical protein
MTNRTQGVDGRFQRLHHPWSLENFDDGYVDAKGRFRVYLPEHPRASSNGYVLRAIVAYEAYHGVSIEPGCLVHHIDENRLNDSKENLEKLVHSVHQLVHKGSDVPLLCEYCGMKFTVKRWRITQRIKERGYPPKFCSQTCNYASGHTPETKAKMSMSQEDSWNNIRRGL